jgi:pSer/pThr/pTyr-binding forkhead associated (FHA) protein
VRQLADDAHFRDSPSVSRRHARITLSVGAATIEDLGSKNGTFVEGARITGPVPLREGVTVRLGSLTVTFRSDAVEGSTYSMTET